MIKNRTFLIATLTTLAISFGSLPATAATPEPTPTTTNSQVTVTSDTTGKLYQSTLGSAPLLVNDSLQKNGVSSLKFINNTFVATSFFSVSYSKDGINWYKSFAPVGETFKAGNIISDANFFKSNSMTVEQIQAFMESKVNCSNGACLKDYTETTFDREANPMCQGYVGAANETSAQIIYKVSEACGVAAEVLLVTLQKEQGLITNSAPASGKFDTAMGYACPDTAACNVLYYGFYNQVYSAAKQFKRYANPVGTDQWFTWIPVGSPKKLQIHPNKACGTQTVTIENQATAGLYYYTPYAPNNAALSAMWGLGDSCSSYGNRNFWQYYNSWFNPEKDYKTFIEWNGSRYVMVDDEGGVAISTNLSSWSRLPNISLASKIDSMVMDAGKIKVVLQDKSVLETSDGTSWTASSITPPVVPVVTVPVYHTVKSGETLSKIARTYKTTVANIMKMNPKIKNSNVIYIRQKIVVAYK
jgi:LysM repeat protein